MKPINKIFILKAMLIIVAFIISSFQANILINAEAASKMMVQLGIIKLAVYLLLTIVFIITPSIDRSLKILISVIILCYLIYYSFIHFTFRGIFNCIIINYIYFYLQRAISKDTKVRIFTIIASTFFLIQIITLSDFWLMPWSIAGKLKLQPIPFTRNLVIIFDIFLCIFVRLKHKQS